MAGSDGGRLASPGVHEHLVAALATMIVAQVRGLLLHLQATRDRDRVDAAFALWMSNIELLVQQSSGRDAPPQVAKQ